MTQQPLTDQQLDNIAANVAATFDQHEPAETRQARWEAAALAAGRTVDRNALRVYMAVADAEQLALANDWARSAASADGVIRRLRAVEDNPRYRLVDGCPHCPDGHTPPDHGQTWGAYVGSERDGDGQPMQIIVARSAGAHVAETDAEWVRQRLNDTSDQEQR